MDKALDDVVKCIINCNDYKKCIELKEKMQTNEDIKIRVEQIKKLQKEYIKSTDEAIKLKLETLEKELMEIPLYAIYMQHLYKVNDMINLVKDELNDYFYKLLNE